MTWREFWDDLDLVERIFALLAVAFVLVAIIGLVGRAVTS